MGCFSKAKTNEEEESRRPSNSKFKQQKLPAWQPILTASTVLPVFFFIGVVFLPIGIGLLVSSNNVKEMVIEYSSHGNCKTCRDTLDLAKFKKGIPSSCNCTIDFELHTKWEGDVYLYYGLTNFYQNHRRYVRSRDDDQLHGNLKQSVNSNCQPFDKNDTTAIAFAPCGAIANSMFSDRFELKKTDEDLEVPLVYKDIAWKSDRETKFKNPSSLSEFDKFLRPKYWTRNISHIDEEDRNDNNGFINQDFIVWMRVAAFPTFRKLYRKLNRNQAEFKNGLPNGHYRLTIHYNYPVKSFDGEKRFILTTSSWLGGKNSFLGIAYIIVGCLCLVFGFIFLVIHMKVRTKPLMT